MLPELLFKSAKENDIEGVVTAQYSIDKSRNLVGYEIGKSLGWGIDKVVMDMMQQISENEGQWTPASIDGRPISSSLTLPVKFKLESDEKDKIQSRRLNIDRLSLGPNPSGGVVNISFELEDKSPVDILFYNMSGQLLLQKSNVPSSYKNEFDLSQYSNQTLIVNIIQNNKIHTNRVIMQ